jgi:2-polyprenyl-3-methyl-5-hydroxy-6-metoxy-1,4-benzoquinol methylase
MPTSRIDNIQHVIAIIQQLNPTTITEIGCGMGKYGLLIREYLDVNVHAQLQRTKQQTKITAIEAQEPYINQYHYNIYDEVIIDDVRNVIDTITNQDIIMMVDVVEHFDKPEAYNIINKLKKQNKHILIVVPDHHIPQGTVYGNVHETHKAVWDDKDIEILDPKQTWNINQSWIILL